MIPYPKLKSSAAYRQVVDKFRGYNHNLRIGSGEFYEMENLTSDDYPVLTPRGKRGLIKELQYDCKGMFYVPEKGLFYLENIGGNSILYLLSSDGVSTEIIRLNPNPKRFVLIGRAVLIVPEMVCVDIENLSSYSIERSHVINSGKIDAQLCDAEGNVYQNVASSTEPPSNPGYHQLWLCTAVGSVGLNQYEPASSQWVSIAATYVKLSGLGDHRFNAGDGVELSGLTGDAFSLNGNTVIRRVGEGEFIIPGIIYSNYMQDCSSAPVTVKRKVPHLDFAVECGNRIWGCIRDTNEIYACKLGDVQNWNCFQSLSTDSWVGSIGTSGEFTGAAVQSGYPVFYKETCKHKVWPSATGAHQITTSPCNGVEKGSENSLAVLDGTAFYKSAFGIFADDGGGAVEIGQALGDTKYHNASGVILNRKYYLGATTESGEHHLLVYDIDRRMWHREGVFDSDYLASGGSSLYAALGNELWDLTGNTGTLEEAVSWMAVTGDLGLELPEQKYISRLTLRLSLDPGATLAVYAQYDREQTWVKLGQVYGTDLRSFSLPVRPRRCDQLRLKLQGTGMCKLYSITKTLEKGSELT